MEFKKISLSIEILGSGEIRSNNSMKKYVPYRFFRSYPEYRDFKLKLSSFALEKKVMYDFYAKTFSLQILNKRLGQIYVDFLEVQHQNYARGGCKWVRSILILEITMAMLLYVY
jgi:hypothetical protein